MKVALTAYLPDNMAPESATIVQTGSCEFKMRAVKRGDGTFWHTLLGGSLQRTQSATPTG